MKGNKKTRSNRTHFDEELEKIKEEQKEQKLEFEKFKEHQESETLQEDTFSIMMISKTWSVGWTLGLVTSLFQLFLVALILWGLDSFLGWLVSLVIG